jgi:hypothetical protein
MKLSYRTLFTQPDFMGAFDRLGQETAIAMKDRYVLALTRRNLTAALETHNELRNNLIKELGKPECEIRERELKVLSDNDPLKPQLLTRLQMARNADSYMVDPMDGEASRKFTEKSEELLGLEFEIALENKLVLPENCKLSSLDMSALLDIVSVA